MQIHLHSFFHAKCYVARHSEYEYHSTKLTIYINKHDVKQLHKKSIFHKTIQQMQWTPAKSFFVLRQRPTTPPPIF